MTNWGNLVPRLVADRQKIWETGQTCARMERLGISRSEISRRTGVNIGGISRRITYAKGMSPVESWCAENIAPEKSNRSPGFYLWAARHHVERNTGIDRDLLQITSLKGLPSDPAPTRIRGTPVD